MLNALKTSISQTLTAWRLGYRTSQLDFGTEGAGPITEASTGREICPFINAPIECEQQGDHTLIRIFAPNTNTVVSEVIGLEGVAA